MCLVWGKRGSSKTLLSTVSLSPHELLRVQSCIIPENGNVLQVTLEPRTSTINLPIEGHTVSSVKLMIIRVNLNLGRKVMTRIFVTGFFRHEVFLFCIPKGSQSFMSELRQRFLYYCMLSNKLSYF